MAWLRRGVIVVLGVVLVVDALVGKRLLVLQFVLGLIMVGLVPIDYVVGLLMRPPDDAADQEAELERLREVLRRHDETAGSEGGETD